MDKFVNVIPAKNKKNNWTHILNGSIKENKKNIGELIQKIRSNFPCIEEERIAYYYFRRNDDNKQFAGIVCNVSELSWIKFRINPLNFNVKDENIKRKARLFFQGARDSERQIRIIPENHILIIECLNHAYKTSSVMNY